MRAGRARRVTAFAPGRVNLIGEHTDYNGGLALPFAIERGVRVEAEANSRDEVVVVSRGFGTDRFSARTPLRASGWRAFARGVVAELGGVPGCRLTVTADLPPAGGLSSSAALTIALALASQGLRGGSSLGTLDLARLCSRVENDWAGTPSGLLDQLAILSGGAVMIEFASLRLEPVSLELDDWTLAVLDSGAPRELAASGYATRRDECAEACRLLRIASLSDATHGDLAHLPAHLARRVRHVLGENDRVRGTRRAERQRATEARVSA